MVGTIKSVIRPLISSVAFAGVVAVASCGGSNEPPAPSIAVSPSTAQQLVPTAPRVLALGERNTFSDGSSLVVTARSYTGFPKDFSLYQGGPVVRFTVTVTNGSPAAIDPTSVLIDVSAGGQPANILTTGYDKTLQQGGGTLLPGQSQTFDRLYELRAPGEVVVKAQTPRPSPAPQGRWPFEQVYYRGTV